MRIAGQKPAAPVINWEPSLRAVVEPERLKAQQLTVALVEPRVDRPTLKQTVFVTDGDKVCPWAVPSLRALFRGDRIPPSLEKYPVEYVPFFFFIEKHVMLFFDKRGDQTDQQMEEIYSMIRRRPDGRSLGPNHDFVWQAAALMLGQYVISPGEFEAIMGQLERSVRHWSLKPVSRNYAAFMRKNNF